MRSGSKDNIKIRKWVRNHKRILFVSNLTVFTKMLQSHPKPMKSQEMTKFRYYTITLILDFNGVYWLL